MQHRFISFTNRFNQQFICFFLIHNKLCFLYNKSKKSPQPVKRRNIPITLQVFLLSFHPGSVAAISATELLDINEESVLQMSIDPTSQTLALTLIPLRA